MQYIVTDEELTTVADAIRAKGGTSSNLEWTTGFVSAIQHIPTGGSEKTQRYGFTQSIESFIAPISGTYQLTARGGQGGKAYSDSYPGGLGGYASGYITLEAGDVLYICVGGAGENGVPRVAAAGGYNGGGGGYPYMNDSSNYAAGGGGASHIARSPGLLKDVPIADVILVAGGGGGAYYHTNGASFSAPGGTGGGTEGGSGFNGNSTYAAGGGGTQSAGGAAGTGGVAGSYGMAGTSTQYSAGGGGGLYGGGGARHQYTGGGSGYIGGVQSGSMINGVNSGNGEVIIQWTEGGGSQSNTVYSGETDPTSSIGTNGCIYLKTKTVGYDDSELGWSSLNGTISKATTSLGTINGRNYYKTNNIAAIVVFCRNGSYWQPHVASTDPDACTFRADSGGPWSYTNSYVINETTWYFHSGEHGFSGSPTINTTFPVIDRAFSFSTQSEAEDFLALVNEIPTSQATSQNVVDACYAKVNDVWQNLIGTDILDIITVQ